MNSWFPGGSIRNDTVARAAVLRGYTALSLAQLKILQEVITLAVFAPFAVVYMRQPLKLDYLWAALCIVGAVYFVFRSPATP